MYVLTWISTYVLYAVLTTWIDGRQLSDEFSTLQKGVLHGSVAMGPWLLSFGIGLIPALIALTLTWKSSNRLRNFWWTALGVCWLFAVIALYANHRAQLSDRPKAETLLADSKAETHLNEVKPESAPPAKAAIPRTFSVIEEQPASSPIITAITIQGTQGTSEDDLTIDGLKNLEQIIVASILKRTRARYIELGEDPKAFRPHIDSNGVYVEVGGKKLAIVRINLDNSVRSIAIMGFRGEEFVRVTCLRESNDEIPLFRGACADKIHEAFGVSLR
jgi:hypothetical protein